MTEAPGAVSLPVPPIRDADCLPGAVLFVTVTWTRLCTGQATVLGNVNGKVLFFSSILEQHFYP